MEGWYIRNGERRKEEKGTGESRKKEMDVRLSTKERERRDYGDDHGSMGSEEARSIHLKGGGSFIKIH